MNRLPSRVDLSLLKRAVSRLTSKLAETARPKEHLPEIPRNIL